MCMMVYIGADSELPIIDFQDEVSDFCARKLNDTYSDDKFAKENLTKEHKYHVGSWQGCGCGFAFGLAGFDDFANEHGRKSVQALFEYIRSNIKSDNCELLSFWAGEGMNEPSRVLDLKDFVLGESFEFLEGQYLTVEK